LVLPPTIQEALSASFDRERQVLLADIERLRDEVQNSTAAYDKYRERARLSLMKTSNEQAGLEKKIKDLNAQIKVSRVLKPYNFTTCISTSVLMIQVFERRALDAELALNRSRESHMSQLRGLRDQISSYVAISEALREEIELLRSQVVAMKQEQQNATSAAVNGGTLSFVDAAKMEVL
jgi:sugar-specific transcriptional regulator TrmB